MTKETASRERYLIFDESGNLGHSGRYFIISCIDTTNPKSLHNIMHTKLGQARKLFPKLAKLHAHEIKAKDAYPCVKHHILECIESKDLSISYIVADLHHIKPRLLTDKNILYNFLTKILLDRLISRKDNGSTIHIICDNHTTKVSSANSFSEYIKLQFVYEKGYDIDIKVTYLDSDAKDAYIVQAADYVANALYGHYEYNDPSFFSIVSKKVRCAELFPYKDFGK